MIKRQWVTAQKTVFLIKKQNEKSVLKLYLSDDHTNITEMYSATEQKCGKFTRFMIYYLLFNMLSYPMALAYAIYCIYMGNFDTSTWNLPMNVVVPFDTQSIFGWLMKWMYEFGGAVSYFLSMTIPTIYFVGFCRYIVAICKHFELLIDAIRLDVEQIQSDQNGRQKHHVREKLSQLIDLHENVLE